MGIRRLVDIWCVPAHTQTHTRWLQSQLCTLLTISHSDCIIHRWVGEGDPTVSAPSQLPVREQENKSMDDGEMMGLVGCVDEHFRGMEEGIEREKIETDGSSDTHKSDHLYLNYCTCSNHM